MASALSKSKNTVMSSSTEKLDVPGLLLSIVMLQNYDILVYVIKLA